MTFEIEDVQLAQGYYYLATPFTKWGAGPYDAVWTAAEITARLVKRGIGVFSPIVHSHYVATAGQLDMLDQEFWLKTDQPMMEGAAGLLVASLDGWRDSYGVGEEIRWFTNAGRVRYLMDPFKLSCQPLP